MLGFFTDLNIRLMTFIWLIKSDKIKRVHKDNGSSLSEDPQLRIVFIWGRISYQTDNFLFSTPKLNRTGPAGLLRWIITFVRIFPTSACAFISLIWLLFGSCHAKVQRMIATRFLTPVFLLVESSTVLKQVDGWLWRWANSIKEIIWNEYIALFILFQISNIVGNECISFCKCLIDIEIGGFSIDILMIVSMLSNTGGTEGHETLLLMIEINNVRCWQKLVIIKSGW